MALTNKLTAIADAIREKTGTTEKLTLDEMPTAISGITTGEGGELYDYIPEEIFTVYGGNSAYRFYGGYWDWFIKQYWNLIKTESLDGRYMFTNSGLEEIKIELNTTGDMSYIFQGCNKLKEIPYLNGHITGLNHWIDNCYQITGFPSDYADKFSINNAGTNIPLAYLFYNCYSLREIPDNLNLKLMSKGTGSSYTPYGNRYNGCLSLNEIRSLPVSQATLTSNLFSSTFKLINRVKNIIFALQEDGSPYIVNWKAQTIDLSSYVGYASSSSNILGYASGITKDKQVTDADTYAALKDDPDWFTLNVAYSRYNHDSAVATINSLPDTSAYGTNIIKFEGASGSATDGGAINTLTEEEIAVATVKGWTVTLV